MVRPLVVVFPGAESIARSARVGDSIAAHPTLAEAFKEAAPVSLDRPIHMPPAKKPVAAAS